MFTLLNRKELYTTYRPEDYFRVKDILHANGIQHFTKFGSNRTSGSRRTGCTPVQNHSTEYRIFVRKQDYEAAALLIHG